MQAFLASDVVYNGRTVPLIKGALDDNEVGGQQIARSKFLPGIEWLEPQFVGDALGQQVSGGNGGTPREPAPACTARLARVDLGRRDPPAAEPDAEPHPRRGRHRLPRELHERRRARRVRRQGHRHRRARESGKPIRKSRTVDTVQQGATAEVEIPLGQRPPQGAATVTVRVDPVPGEEKTDNNEAEYDVGFVAP